MKNRLLWVIVGGSLGLPLQVNAQFGAAILNGVLNGLSSGGSSATTEKPRAKTIYDVNEFFPEVSRIELRTIQTRKFKKSSSQVFSAIKSLCADANGRFSGMLPVYKGSGKVIAEKKTPIGSNAYTSEFTYEKYEKDERFSLMPITCIRPTGLGGGEFSMSGKPGIFRYAILKYELDWNPGGDIETTVRMRISWSEDPIEGRVGGGSAQTTNPIFYQSNFKELADGLFIDAIELTPAEMQ